MTARPAMVATIPAPCIHKARYMSARNAAIRGVHAGLQLVQVLPGGEARAPVADDAGDGLGLPIVEPGVAKRPRGGERVEDRSGHRSGSPSGVELRRR